MIRTLLPAAGAVLLTAGMAWANGAPAPAPRPPVRPLPPPVEPPVNVEPAKAEPDFKADAKAQLTIEARDDVNESRLIIPRKLAGAAGAGPRGDAGDQGLPPLNLAMAGIAMSAAVAVGGLWLVRTRRVSATTAKLAAGASVLLGVGGWVIADVPAPRPVPRPRPPVVAPPQPPKVELPAAVLTGPVLIQYVDEGNEIKLVVNRRMLAKLGPAAPKPVEAPPAPPIVPGGIPVEK
jgi:hypothetical protein